ncbi:probable phosphoglycerate mutase [Natronoarchaeum philippinense]|uniref:Probable phosphoglycerate mutase n=1 Tax=Natronoarchaeum philippinense TaxID=558529 RepID=A0A285P2V6_NATPI|nr:histidine phosphatase family protein [Natronoarchaeum philippinense]SNZ15597.1 probable phosphoglycerate mutase [Natronoarchaeum philippinense]
MGTVVLVRHGETAWNDERRIQGWAPASLNDRGRQQAKSLGEHVAARYEVDRIVASDLRRTTETAREVGRALPGIDVEFARAWRERDFGVLQGLAYGDLFGEYPEFSVQKSGYDAATARPEGGESWVDVFDRIRDAWTELIETVGEETVVVVSHGGPIHVVIGLLRGYDVIETITKVELDNCALTEVGVDGDGAPTLHREGETAFLDADAEQ